MLTITHPVDLREIQKSLTEFVGYGGIKVTTVQASFGFADVDDVVSGRATAERVIATSDARGYVPQWHGGDSDESVYVEVYSALGREFHGFIDRDSRKIVQAG